MGWGVVGAGVSTVVGATAGFGFIIWYGRRRPPAQLRLLRWEHVSARHSLVARLWPVAWPESTWLFVGYLNEITSERLANQPAHRGRGNLSSLHCLSVVSSVSDTLAAVG
ncbi:MAG: hypothetical protein ACRDRK_03725 [Pseudonocardia sp.]